MEARTLDVDVDRLERVGVYDGLIGTGERLGRLAGVFEERSLRSAESNNHVAAMRANGLDRRLIDAAGQRAQASHFGLQPPSEKMNASENCLRPVSDITPRDPLDFPAEVHVHGIHADSVAAAGTVGTAVRGGLADLADGIAADPIGCCHASVSSARPLAARTSWAFPGTATPM